MKQCISSLDLPQYKIQQLTKLGYNYVEEINISTDCAGLLQKNLNILKHVPCSKSALDICQEEYEMCHLKTLCKSLDKVLGLGVPVKHITEFCGEPGTGKTQICLQMCINVQLPVCCGGLNGEAIYISTNNSLIKNRMKELTENALKRISLIHQKHSSTSLEVTTNDILKGVNFFRAEEYVELIAVVKCLSHALEKKKVNLIIIDSICAPLKHINDHKERLSILNTILMELQILGDKYNTVIVLTNDLTTRITPLSTNNLTLKVPCLGDSYFHRLNQRFLFSRIDSDSFKVSALKSIRRGPVSCKFLISDCIRDV